MTIPPIPTAALDDRLAFIGTSGSGKTFAAKGRVEVLLAKKHRVVIVDPLDVWFGLRLTADGKHDAFKVAILGGRHADLPLTEHSGALIGEAVARSEDSCIVSLTGLRTSAARQRFMLSFLDALYERTDPDARDPYHVIFDEADLWAPQKPMGNEAMLAHLMEEIVRRGRVKGFIPWLITQRPAVLNKNVLSQADGLIALKLTSSQDRDAIGAWIEGQADRQQGKEILASLPTLQQGHGVVWIPGRGILNTVTFPENATFDSSRTPKRGEKKRNTTLKPLDIAGLKDKLATVEAETKANDPKALKAEIAQLRKQLADAANAKPAPIDPAALAAAEERGFERGKREVAAAADKRIKEARLHMAEALIDQVRALFDRLTEEQRAARTDKTKIAAQVTFTPSVTNGSGSPHAAAGPRPGPARVATATPRRNPSPAAGGDGAVDPSQMKIVRALVFWHSIGNETPSRAQVAAVAGYTATAGRFNNLMGSLRAAGMIDYPANNLVRLLQNPTDLEMSMSEARDALFSVLDASQRKIIEAVDPRSQLAREEVATLAGYEPTAGRFNNLLGSLRTLDVVRYPTKGMVELSDWAAELLAA
jgi:hypothetical protein